jgi:hypothetical protein
MYCSTCKGFKGEKGKASGYGGTFCYCTESTQNINLKNAIDLIASNPEWFKQCHKNKGTAVLCICDSCKKELSSLIGNKNVK